jgi:hypothetical protein
MRGTARAAILPGVSDSRIAIHLQVDPAGESLSGVARAENGPNRTFSGWLGLISAIDELISASPTAPPLSAPPPIDDENQSARPSEHDSRS